MRRITRPAGFTLVELCIVLTVAGLLLTVAWPSYRTQLLRGQRADAVAALQRVQLAQESHRAFHGLYAAQLDALRGAAAPRSSEGRYDIALHGGGVHYEAVATARGDTLAAADTTCAELRLRVHDGLAEYAPSARCWNR